MTPSPEPLNPQGEGWTILVCPDHGYVKNPVNCVDHFRCNFNCSKKLVWVEVVPAPSPQPDLRAVLEALADDWEEAGLAAGMMKAKARRDADLDGVIVHEEAARIYRSCAQALRSKLKENE